jgi:two-component system response regulator HydG
MEALAVALHRALEHRALRREVRRLRDAAKSDDVRELSGSSDAIRRVRELIARVADSDASVLITGESGTGKEVAARALHRMSRRAKGPLVAINCAAVPAQLLESELFGYMKGAFTDARADRVGVFKQADSGTLVLDEVGELPLALQPKLLRALQERSVRPLGAQAEEAFDARIISITNVDLEERVSEGQFREDLFYRFNVITLTMPPLRARAQDLLELAQDFITKASQRSGKGVRGLTPEAAKRLVEYDWPGNVRELENCIERAVAFTTFDHILVDDLPERVRAGPGRAAPVDGEEATLSMETVERRHVMRVLEAQGGNRTRAAKILGLDRKTLQRKLERWGMTE